MIAGYYLSWFVLRVPTLSYVFLFCLELSRTFSYLFLELSRMLSYLFLELSRTVSYMFLHFPTVSYFIIRYFFLEHYRCFSDFVLELSGTLPYLFLEHSQTFSYMFLHVAACTCFIIRFPTLSWNFLELSHILSLNCPELSPACSYSFLHFPTVSYVFPVVPWTFSYIFLLVHAFSYVFLLFPTLSLNFLELSHIFPTCSYFSYFLIRFPIFHRNLSNFLLLVSGTFSQLLLLYPTLSYVFLLGLWNLSSFSPTCSYFFSPTLSTFSTLPIFSNLQVGEGWRR